MRGCEDRIVKLVKYSGIGSEGCSVCPGFRNREAAKHPRATELQGRPEAAMIEKQPWVRCQSRFCSTWSELNPSVAFDARSSTVESHCLMPRLD